MVTCILAKSFITSTLRTCMQDDTSISAQTKIDGLNSQLQEALTRSATKDTQLATAAAEHVAAISNLQTTHTSALQDRDCQLKAVRSELTDAQQIAELLTKRLAASSALEEEHIACIQGLEQQHKGAS
jgi:tRNA U34 5-carboxymethylaminomethyl modifying GTPase MnmE/TrmE